MNKNNIHSYIITGSTGGIGKQLVNKLDKKNNQLILISKSEEKLMNLKKHISHAKSFIVVADITDLSFIDKLKDINFGMIKGFIHCAGIESIAPLRIVKYEKFDLLMRINFYSFIEIMKFINRLKNKDDDYFTSVVGISSIASRMGGVGQIMYSCSKAALEASSKVLNKELFSKKIRINMIKPGLVNTEMTERWRKKVGIKTKEELNNLQLNGICESSDIVELIVFLLNDISNHIVSTEIPIDGGGPINKIF